MKTFRCACGNLLFFENSDCLNCRRRLGYIPELNVLSALEPAGAGLWRALALDGEARYRLCPHYEREQVCNWLVPADAPQAYCAACRLNQVIPNLDKPGNRSLWYRLEQSKRRLLYGLFRLGLPVVGRAQDPQCGLAFAFLEDDPVYRESGAVVTGHQAGLITINVAEADDVARERARDSLNEPYRTLLGHFRHESGHYYWERLVHAGPSHEAFRELFGDERPSYDQALAAYYRQGAPPDWQSRYISAYASVHPWEDWAESWAHYLHMIDTLESAHDFGLVGKQGMAQQAWSGRPLDVYDPQTGFDALMEDWYRLSIAVNSISRSMGQKDVYPFVIGAQAQRKLHLVHRIIRASRRSPS